MHTELLQISAGLMGWRGMGLVLIVCIGLGMATRVAACASES
jgi:hypothetical protein